MRYQCGVPGGPLPSRFQQRLAEAGLGPSAQPAMAETTWDPSADGQLVERVRRRRPLHPLDITPELLLGVCFFEERQGLIMLPLRMARAAGCRNVWVLPVPAPQGGALLVPEFARSGTMAAVLLFLTGVRSRQDQLGQYDCQAAIDVYMSQEHNPETTAGERIYR